MPADEAPDDNDDQLRQTYNFAPGYHGLIYRANTSERGAGQDETEVRDGEPSPKRAKLAHATTSQSTTHDTRYRLQSARWGLIPFWTKRPPDYASQMRTINCRDDSLAQNGGMWNTMKQRKRCIVVAEGFYEWLKKNNSKEKIPHFIKRRDGGLMCMAGLWDCVRYEKDEGEGRGEPLWTYTIITTNSNKQLNFLHDRMPVILEPGSEEMRKWLDPGKVGWDKELQSLLKPFQGELEVYPVDKAVGKVGNNSPSFVVPVDSKENKKNIANFFGNQAAKAAEGKKEEPKAVKQEAIVKKEGDEDRQTSRIEDPETGAPLPKPPGQSDAELEKAIETEASSLPAEPIVEASDEKVERGIKREISELDDESMLKVEESPMKKQEVTSPVKKSMSPVATNKTRSAVKNEGRGKKGSPVKAAGGDKKITAFFGK